MAKYRLTLIIEEVKAHQFKSNFKAQIKILPFYPPALTNFLVSMNCFFQYKNLF